MSCAISRTRLAIVAVLALHTAVLLDCIRKNFVSVDEGGHLVAGICHWETGNYGMYRVNPPLPRMLAVLPVLLARPDTSGIRFIVGPGARAEWPSARQFATDNAKRYLAILFLARLAGVGWSLLGGWLIYRWSSELYGGRAGLVGLVVWCFEPNVLASAQMATPDLPAAVAGLAATYGFWRYLRAPSWQLAWLAGLLLGIAELTKFTLLLLYAVWPLLWFLYRLRAPARSLPLAARAGHALLILVVSLFVLSFGYEFDGTGKPLKEFAFVSRTLGGETSPGAGWSPPGGRFGSGWLGEVRLPIPAEFLCGIDAQRRDFEGGYFSYLDGEWRDHGWWYYYGYALALKVPLGVWGLVLWGAALTIGRHPASVRWQDELFLWLPALAVLVLVSSQTGFNHHLRYVLPLFPFVIVSAAKVAYFLQPGHRKARVLVVALILWAAGSSLAVHPHYLSYFNEPGGGPDQGHDHLIDSNIDWGQDLLFLKAWLDEHPEGRPLGLAYYNFIDPRVIGIDYTQPPKAPHGSFADEPRLAADFGPHPGYFALDVNFIRGASFFTSDGRGGLNQVGLHDYEYFRSFRPISKAGYSIFIYHISLDEANAVRRELGLPALPGLPARQETP